MPKSRIRKKDDRTPPPAPVNKANLPSPPWVAPLMIGLFGFGLLWVVVYYVSQGKYPITGMGNGNLLLGFGFITSGFVAATQWR